MNLSPNCISRSADCVLPMMPKLELPKLPPGGPNVGWLRMLKNSARNCIFSDSAMCVSFAMEKSRFHQLGPVYVLRPKLPGVNCTVDPSTLLVVVDWLK